MGPQHRETGKTVSTDNASWGGPNTEKLNKQFQQALRPVAEQFLSKRRERDRNLFIQIRFLSRFLFY
ncbi:hypothetical protein [Staphylococcus marylandisciuri]|uniref:hypothetical protein n=1 Tax=Staphylococcus marylandisciuri TaxID=2981529 RepID=UPI0021D010C3|nr:hypothetical protein [Staphylococcus marylandisciuri]